MNLENNENDRTLWVGNIGDNVTEEILWELFLQAGPLLKVKIPCDKDGNNRKSFAFITFKHTASVPYSIELLNGLRIFGRSLRLQCRSGSVHMNRQSSVGSPQTPQSLMDSNPFQDMSGGAFPRSMSAPQIARNDSSSAIGFRDSTGASPRLGQVANISGLSGSPNQMGFSMSRMNLPKPVMDQGYSGNSPLSSSPAHTPEACMSNQKSFSGNRERRESRDSDRWNRDDRRDRDRGRDDRRKHDNDRRDSRHDNRWERDNRNSGTRYDSRSSDEDSIDRKRQRQHNALASQVNLNPQQRHMQPSPRRKPWEQQGRSGRY